MRMRCLAALSALALILLPACGDEVTQVVTNLQMTTYAGEFNDLGTVGVTFEPCDKEAPPLIQAWVAEPCPVWDLNCDWRELPDQIRLHLGPDQCVINIHGPPNGRYWVTLIEGTEDGQRWVRK